MESYLQDSLERISAATYVRTLDDRACPVHGEIAATGDLLGYCTFAIEGRPAGPGKT